MECHYHPKVLCVVVIWDFCVVTEYHANISRIANIKSAYTCMSFNHAEAYVVNHSYLLLLVLLEISNHFKPRSYKTLFLEESFNLTPCLAHWFTYFFCIWHQIFHGGILCCSIVAPNFQKISLLMYEINNNKRRIKSSMYRSCPVASYMHLKDTGLQYPAP